MSEFRRRCWRDLRGEWRSWIVVQRDIFDLRGESEKALESRVQSDPIRQVDSSSREMERRLMKAPQQIEHWPVVVVEQAPRYVHYVVGGYTNEILVERAVVDRAQTQAVANGRCAAELSVADDVRGVQQAQLL